MEKMKNIFKWVAFDGLLHILCVFAILMALTPIIGLWWGLGITTIVAALKEAYDVVIQQDNNKEQVIHDAICDGVGIVLACAVMLLWL